MTLVLDVRISMCLLGRHNKTHNRPPQYFCIKQESGHSNVALYTFIPSSGSAPPLPVPWEIITVTCLNVLFTDGLHAYAMVGPMRL